MGLSLGEGEEGSPVLWGPWEWAQLAAGQIGIERILLAASPSGRRFLTVPVGQRSHSLHQSEHGSKITRKLDAAIAVPAHPWNTPDERVYGDFEAAFVEADRVDLEGAGHLDEDAAPAAGTGVAVAHLRSLAEGPAGVPRISLPQHAGPVRRRSAGHPQSFIEGQRTATVEGLVRDVISAPPPVSVSPDTFRFNV